jgi:hypothetical protein
MFQIQQRNLLTKKVSIVKNAIDRKPISFETPERAEAFALSCLLTRRADIRLRDVIRYNVVEA